MKKRKKVNISQIILIIVLSIICLLWIFPLIYILLTSFRTDKSIMFEGFQFFPTKWTLDTYKLVLANTSDAPIIRWFINSLLSSSITAILVVLHTL